MSIEESINALKTRIDRSGRLLEDIKIVGVSKKQPLEKVLEAKKYGITHFGENYGSELLEKFSQIETNDIEIHFIGNIQRREIKNLATYVTWWHSVTRINEIEEILNRSPNANILIQLNLLDDGRRGLRREDLKAVMRELTGSLVQIRGFMSIGENGNLERTRSIFRETKSLVAEYGLSEVSIGMTQDLDVALDEGSTIVRVGEGIFGQRT